jgi:hypothetical protein
MDDREIQEFLKQHFVKVTYSMPNSSFTNTNPNNGRSVIGYMTVNARGKGGGQSKKIKNVTYRLKDVCLALVDKGLLIAGAVSLSSGIAVIGACLLTLNDLNEKLKIELSETESLIVFSLFILSTQTNTTTLDALRERIYFDAEKGKISVPTDIQINQGIQNLASINAVRVSELNIELIEEVSIRKCSR